MALTMAASCSSYSSRTISDPPTRYSTKAFVGLRPESTGLFRNERFDSTIALHERVQQCVKSRLVQKGACRARVTMMPIGTPKVPYRTPGEGGWQWVDIWNALYRERIIFIGQYIDEEFSNQILATMLYLDSIDSSKDLYLYINGPGGDVTPCMAIYDTMESLKSPIGTLCLGYAYNLAGFLLAAGAKGRRVAMPLARVALQSPAGAARGQADDIQNEAKELLRTRDYVFQQLANKTGQPVEKIAKDLSRIKRFSAQEALDYGLIDRIVRPRRIKPDASSKKEAGVGLG
eukprot:Gb_34615 [translate_table: standard]